ncbi:MAG: 3-oxoacyl-[acyl-carrier-protein] reductase [Syntrophales bacterium]|nr:3-oxoacyl-[acyl-carrier-protein] reductase [Syntrophales bacterium]HPL63833.1 3-oxoacyl-[acyl-carrier-protein] reductase [Syntrophales bacterium]
MTLSGRVALVTGGSRGIGRAVSLKLAGEGAYTIVNYVNRREAARETLRLIRERGGDGEVAPFDVADAAAAAEEMGRIIKEKGRLDILVNNAGISRDGLIVRMKEQDWDRTIDTNLKGAFNCCRVAARQMIRQRWGRIVNVASVVAEAGNPGQVNYCASKAGVIGLTKALARELASRNIRVNAVSPGLIETDMTASLEERKEEIRDSIPLLRLGNPDDVAGAVLFLVSPESDYITGQVIRVDGGLYM